MFLGLSNSSKIHDPRPPTPPLSRSMEFSRHLPKGRKTWGTLPSSCCSPDLIFVPVLNGFENFRSITTEPVDFIQLLTLGLLDLNLGDHLICSTFLDYSFILSRKNAKFALPKTNSSLLKMGVSKLGSSGFPGVSPIFKGPRLLLV